MLPGPIVRRELKAAALRRGQFAARTVLALVLAAVTLLPVLTAFGWASEVSYDGQRDELKTIGEIVLVALPSIEILVFTFLAPALVAGAIAEEWERDTLPFLLISRLTRVEIVVAKLVGRLLPLISTASVGVPLMFLAAWAAGLPTGSAALIAAALLSTVGVMAALAMFASARRRQVGQARGEAMMLVGLWLVVPLTRVVPVRLAAPWDELYAWFKSACALVAPSSPLSLITDGGWYRTTGSGALRWRLLLMLAMQAGLGTLAVLGAAASLGARERYPYWWDPYRGYRPPCGDDPIFWREYELPSRRGAAPRWVIWGRYLSSLFWMLVTVVLRLTLACLVFAIPIGLVAATIQFGYPAFLELWRNGYSPAGRFEARTSFNLLVRIASGILGLPMIGIAASAESRITLERSKGTWPILLTTPLTGAEIVRSKMRATFEGLKSLLWFLAPLWLLGVACGAVHPLGALVAAVDLPLAAWAGVAFGLKLGLRPTSKAGASTAAALGSLALVAVHGPLLIAALSSLRDVREFLSWSPWVRAPIVAAMVAVPPLTARLAWSLTRQSFLHFDEWADRPTRRRTTATEQSDLKGDEDLSHRGHRGHSE
jgi:ABC-type transport system involved in multi-copper enzyme maturation permease subunit